MRQSGSELRIKQEKQEEKNPMVQINKSEAFLSVQAWPLVRRVIILFRDHTFLKADRRCGGLPIINRISVRDATVVVQ
jgi:hypothetical protein